MKRFFAHLDGTGEQRIAHIGSRESGLAGDIADRIDYLDVVGGCDGHTEHSVSVNRGGFFIRQWRVTKLLTFVDSGVSRSTDVDRLSRLVVSEAVTNVPENGWKPVKVLL